MLVGERFGHRSETQTAAGSPPKPRPVIVKLTAESCVCSRTAARKRFRLTLTATWPAFDSTVGVDACHCLGVDLSEGRFCIIVTRVLRQFCYIYKTA